VPGIVITDKECVDKTYPEFWYDLEFRFGVQLSVPSTTTRAVAPVSEQGRATAEGDDRSIVIVGMRGSGKTTMGRSLANHLGWHFFDIDAEFERFVGEPIKSFVEKHGWPAFRAKEEELVRKVLDENPQRAVVSTGGGIVETPTALEYLLSKKKALFSIPLLSAAVISALSALDSLLWTPSSLLALSISPPSTFLALFSILTIKCRTPTLWSCDVICKILSPTWVVTLLEPISVRRLRKYGREDRRFMRR